MRKKFFLYLFFYILFVPTTGFSYSKNIEHVIQYLNKHYPSKYTLISNITEKYGKRVVFPKNNIKVTRGEELLVLHREKKLPLYLLPQSAVIKVSSFFQNKVLAHIMYELGPQPQIGDPVTIPGAPVIYLYTNLKNKNSIKIYQELLKKLISSNYQVVELYQHNLINPQPEYGLVLRLEYDNHLITIKICSIYSGNTLFTESFNFQNPLATYEPPGYPILLSTQTQLAKNLQHKQITSITPGVKKELSYKLPSTSFKETTSFIHPSTPYKRKLFRISGRYVRLVSCKILNKDVELALLNKRGIYVVKYTSEGIIPEFKYIFKKQDLIPINIHAMDINNDGRDELMVTLGEEVHELDAFTTKLCSMILEFKNNSLVPLIKDFPYYFRVIEDRSGKSVLLAQRKGETDPYEGDIYHLTWNEDIHKFNIEPYLPAKDVYCIYQFNLIPGDKNHIIILEPTNFLTVYYTPTEKVEAISDRSYGTFDVVPFRIKLKEPRYLGGFTKETSKVYYAYRRFVFKHEYANQNFLIDKQRKTSFGVKKIKQIVLNENAEDSLVGVKWNGQEVVETWRSRKMAKDILDFTFVPNNEILLLVKDRLGCALVKVP
ncbi:hypothetical protein JCM12298_18570 [Desulfothermus naphthae]